MGSPDRQLSIKYGRLRQSSHALTHHAQLYLNTFNLLWSSLLPIVTAVLDQDLDAKVLLHFPQLYEVVSRHACIHLLAMH